ncbi:MAG: dihydrolipoyllysine-residue acetyltransferase [Gammaproteobacteria bacterium]
MTELVDIKVPDIGDFDAVEVIEVMVSTGDTVQIEDSLITVESDKAAMEIPSEINGIVREININVGDKVAQGNTILRLEPVADTASSTTPKEETNETVVTQKEPAPEAVTVPPTEPSKPVAAIKDNSKSSPTAALPVASINHAHASPAVRKFARELGVDLNRVSGSGRSHRILKEDVQTFVKQALSQPAAAGSLGVEAMPDVDFSQWGEVESLPLSKINVLTGKFLHRNWVSIPHVTQFDEADITDLEAFRKTANQDYADKGIKVTLLSFIMKAVVSTLKEYPRFNTSLDNSGLNLIQKNYFHIGIAVSTADGLVVPVIRDVDQKNLSDLAIELREVSGKAREKKLKPSDMQGGCFTISSLGGIGGTQFTPIVNAPEVAILGVSRSKMQPVWNGSEFEPRLMCPLSLSYDHRVVDGADGAAFAAYLSRLLSDVRRLLM